MCLSQAEVDICFEFCCLGRLRICEGRFLIGKRNPQVFVTESSLSSGINDMAPGTLDRRAAPPNQVMLVYVGYLDSHHP